MSSTIDLSLDFAPYRLTGRVYGVLLNHHSAVEALGEAAHKPPYKAPAKAPILYLKPANTLAASGSEAVVPHDPGQLEVGASLGIIIGPTACHVSEASALAHVAGYLLVNDISIPHLPYYRPSIRFKARDGFCTLGIGVPRLHLNDPDNCDLRVSIDGELKQVASTKELVRSTRKLLADVTEFMTLQPGDILALGAAGHAPQVRAGQAVSISAAGFPPLNTSFVGERY